MHNSDLKMDRFEAILRLSINETFKIRYFNYILTLNNSNNYIFKSTYDWKVGQKRPARLGSFISFTNSVIYFNLTCRTTFVPKI